MKRTDDDYGGPLDGRPWSGPGPGPRKLLRTATRARPGRSQHHAPRPPEEFEALSPHAVLEPIPTALYDCFEIGPQGFRPTAPYFAPWERHHGIHWRGLTDARGKTDAEITPWVNTNGDLDEPRIFDLRRVSLVFQPLLQWFEPDPNGPNAIHVAAPYAGEGVHTSQLRADVAAIKGAGTFRWRQGERDYLVGPLSLLPQPTGLLIPPRQLFYAEVAFVVRPALRYTWRVYVRGEGFLGREIT